MVTPKDAYLLEQMHVIDPRIPGPAEAGLAILQTPRATAYGWEKDLQAKFAAQITEATVIRRSPGEHILCLSYWDIASVVDIDPHGGTYIHSASEAYDEEQRIDHGRLSNWLDYFGFTKVGGLPGAEKGAFHASGHIDGPGMEWLIETINPAKLLPVHSQKLGWFEKRWPEKVIRAAEGKSVQFD